MNKGLIVCLLMLVGSIHAQTTFVHNGETVAHGVDLRGEMPEALREMLSGRLLSQRSESARGTLRRQRARIASNRDIALPERTIGPLLKSIRAQEAPYNLLCPYWTYDDGTTKSEPCVSGCVATSIEQVMAYYRYPEELIDTLFGWSTPNYSVDNMLPGTRFDWDNYLNDYRTGWNEAQGNAIALVTLAVGLGVHMNYGPVTSSSSLWRIVGNLKRAFGYGTAECYDRLLFSPRNWHRMLQNELAEGRPLAYSGANMVMSGHAFNIDGVDTDGYYHVNWGYNGAYDGWYDLDWLNPWEPTDTLGTGIAEGMFSNQYALVMHPSADIKVLDSDTIDIEDIDVELREIKLLRQPDCIGHIPADFTLHNAGNDTVTFTYAVLSYLPTDTMPAYQADYVGISTINILPGETRTQRLYLRFSEEGTRLLSIVYDELPASYQLPIEVISGTRSKLEWGSVSTQFGPNSVTASAKVQNVASSGTAGELVTFCLYSDGHEGEDLRHYRVLQTPAGSSETVEATFTGLQEGVHYTLLVRCPWKVQTQTDFIMPHVVGIDEVSKALPASSEPVYDLSGRRIDDTYKVRGLYISRGRKLLKH